ncbi:MAG: hypothetical protein JW712_05655 [Dehalococcoidales bacterium]|nr:hypothetical protein [Dehalococcoidales bacterium]
MGSKKYSNNIIKGPLSDHTDLGYFGTSIMAHDDEYGAGVSLGYHCINSTDYSYLDPHTHDFHELLAFIGGNPEDINDFGAEVRICLGKEMEEHIIDSATVVSIPPGLVHCPLRVTKCEKPIVMLEISRTKKYESEVVTPK